jgi:hypothetical protein
MVDGVEGEQYNDVTRPMFRPDGKRLAHFAAVGKKYVVVVDGRESRQNDAFMEIILSPNGERLAYLAREGALLLAICLCGEPCCYRQR